MTEPQKIDNYTYLVQAKISDMEKEFPGSDSGIQAYRVKSAAEAGGRPGVNLSESGFISPKELEGQPILVQYVRDEASGKWDNGRLKISTTSGNSYIISARALDIPASVSREMFNAENAKNIPREEKNNRLDLSNGDAAKAAFRDNGINGSHSLHVRKAAAPPPQAKKAPPPAAKPEQAAPKQTAESAPAAAEPPAAEKVAGPATIVIKTPEGFTPEEGQIAAAIYGWQISLDPRGMDSRTAHIEALKGRPQGYTPTDEDKLAVTLIQAEAQRRGTPETIIAASRMGISLDDEGSMALARGHDGKIIGKERPEVQEAFVVVREELQAKLDNKKATLEDTKEKLARLEAEQQRRESPSAEKEQVAQTAAQPPQPEQTGAAPPPEKPGRAAMTESGNRVAPFNADVQEFQALMMKDKAYQAKLSEGGIRPDDGFEGPRTRQVMEDYAQEKGLNLKEMSIKDLVAHAKQHHMTQEHAVKMDSDFPDQPAVGASGVEVTALRQGAPLVLLDQQNQAPPSQIVIDMEKLQGELNQGGMTLVAGQGAALQAAAPSPAEPEQPAVQAPSVGQNDPNMSAQQQSPPAMNGLLRA